MKQVKENFEKFRANLKDADQYSYAPRGLLIFLDDSEDSRQMDAIREPLEKDALDSNTGPIIASSLLIYSDDLLPEFKSSG